MVIGTLTYSLKQQQAIRQLENNDQIIIKMADKEGEVVILNKTAFKQMAIKILGDNNTYKE